MLAERIPAPEARLCVTCGSISALEQHEPAGRANDRLVYVFKCPRCHAVSTARQYTFGFDLAPNGERSLADTAWALLAGIVFEIAQLTRAECECLEPCARGFETVARGIALALDLLSEKGELRHPGPNPVRNDRHATVT